MTSSSSPPAMKAIVSMDKQARNNPFATATEAAEAAAYPNPQLIKAVSQRSLAVRTPSPLGEARPMQQQQQRQQVLAKPPKAPFSKRRFGCCMRPEVIEEESVGSNLEETATPSSVSSSPAHKKTSHHWHVPFSPKQSLRGQVLAHQGSAAYSDAEW